ncbi:MAG TPA: DPP IV N-terminal domain-containing protein [Candidatus Saccharimonadales bacterium]|nr:DPP IV N-terminal domain-containing protein [Candidatus Saccharimonadales bacterium]
MKFFAILAVFVGSLLAGCGGGGGGGGIVATGHIVFVSSETSHTSKRIYLMRADGVGQPTALTDGSANADAPALSPDGQKVVFTLAMSGNTQIWTMNKDGTGLAQLTNSSGDNASPCFSPDGVKIAFMSSRNGRDQIFTMNADGSVATPLTDLNSDNDCPVFSSDGLSIVFASQRDGNSHIYIMNVDGSNPIRLTNSSSGDTHPTTNPAFGQGNVIAFERDTAVGKDIYVVNSKTLIETRLTNNGHENGQPAFSSDGNWIAYSSNESGNPEAVFVMREDGSNHHLVGNGLPWSYNPNCGL